MEKIGKTSCMQLQQRGQWMTKPTIVIAANSKFRFYVEHLIQSVGKQGYAYILYDLGDLGAGEQFSAKVSKQPFKTIPAKPFIILDALDHVEENEFVVWMDADTLLFNTIDEIIDDYDIGVTIRKEKHKSSKARTINAGVIFARNTLASREFLQRWGEKSMKLGGDQWALNELCDFPLGEVGKTKEVLGAVVKGFPCSVYNNFYFNKHQSEIAKIVHYKSDFRKKYPYKIRS